MIAGKRRASGQNAREAKSKKALLVLLPLFLILAFIQGPRLVSAMTGGGAEEASAPATSSPAAATTAPEQPPASAAAPGTNGEAAAQDGGEDLGLPPTDVPPSPGDGQLVSFSRFVPKDPFRPLAGGAPVAPSAAATPSLPAPLPPAPPAASPSASSPPAASGGPAPASTRTASIDVNGSVERVAVKEAFPNSDPVFRLVAVTADTAEIGLVRGSFGEGRKTIDLRVGEKVVLVSRPDGVRYRVTLVAVK